MVHLADKASEPARAAQMVLHGPARRNGFGRWLASSAQVRTALGELIRK
jgi:hypothetical protein